MELIEKPKETEGNGLSPTRELVANIIDRVEEVILEANPDISVEGKEGNDLLYGEKYYDLEDELVEEVEDLIKSERKAYREGGKDGCE